VAVPRGVVSRRGDPVDAQRVVAKLHKPVVVKQATGTGVGVGVHLARNGKELAELVAWHHRIRGRDVIVEQFIPGCEFSGWVIERGGDPFCYGLVEIRKPRGAPILDQGAKLRSTLVSAFSSEPQVPETLPMPTLSAQVRAKLEATVVAAHRACGLRHYSRIDLILHNGDTFVLDVNAAPEVAEVGLGAVAERRGDTFADVVTSLAREAMT
jgi:D-alanine-D-alanine ligase